MATSERYYVLVAEAITRLWQKWGRGEVLYLTVANVSEEAKISKVTARKHLNKMHEEGWIGHKSLGKTAVYTVVL